MPIRKYTVETKRNNRMKFRADQNEHFLTEMHGKGDRSFHGENMQMWLSINARKRKAKFFATLVVFLIIITALIVFLWLVN